MVTWEQVPALVDGCDDTIESETKGANTMHQNVYSRNYSRFHVKRKSSKIPLSTHTSIYLPPTIWSCMRITPMCNNHCTSLSRRLPTVHTGIEKAEERTGSIWFRDHG